MDENLVRVQAIITTGQLAQIQRIVFERKQAGDRQVSQTGIIREALDMWLKAQKGEGK